MIMLTTATTVMIVVIWLSRSPNLEKHHHDGENIQKSLRKSDLRGNHRSDENVQESMTKMMTMLTMMKAVMTMTTRMMIKLISTVVTIYQADAKIMILMMSLMLMVLFMMRMRMWMDKYEGYKKLTLIILEHITFNHFL